MGFTVEGLLSCNYSVFPIPQVGHGLLCSHSVGCKDVVTKAPPSDVEFLRTLERRTGALMRQKSKCSRKLEDDIYRLRCSQTIQMQEVET